MTDISNCNIHISGADPKALKSIKALARAAEANARAIQAIAEMGRGPTTAYGIYITNPNPEHTENEPHPEHTENESQE